MGTSVNFTADARGLIDAANQVAQSQRNVGAGFTALGTQVRQYNVNLEDVTSTQTRYAANGRLLGAVIQSNLNSFEQLTTRIRVNRAGLAQISQEVRSTTQDMSAFGGVIERVQRSFTYFAAYKAFNFIADGLKEGISAAKDLQVQISLIRTISQENQQTAPKFTQDVRQVSDKSGIPLDQVGKAFYDVASNQIAKGAQIKPFVEQAAEFARVTGSTLPDSVNLLSGAIHSYGLSVSDADRISAQFFRTIDEGRVVASELANTFGRVGILGANLGVSIEDLQATLAITTQKGFKTTDAMTLLTNILIKLEKPTEATSAFFKSLGVSSGESAIQLFGFTGVLRKMVDAVKSGQVDVSAFFDEIRGRKQFGVFQQSIDQIEQFSAKLKDTTGTMKVYQEAVKIRGESPADFLVKESQKLKNVFTVDLGQQILNYTANTLKAVGGTDAITAAVRYFGDAAKFTAATVAIYATGLGAATLATNLFSASQTRAQLALFGLARSLAFVVVAYGSYKGAQNALRQLGFGQGESDIFGFDIARVQQDLQSVKDIRKQIDAERARKDGKAADPFANINRQQGQVGDLYKGALEQVAELTKKNDAMLEKLKARSQETAQAMKSYFGTYLDGLKDTVNQLNREITQAKKNLEDSAKSALGFKNSLDDIIYKTKLKYADTTMGGTENQKVQLTDQRIAQLTAGAKKFFQESKDLEDQADKAFAAGDKDKATLLRAEAKSKVDLARKTFDEIAQLEEQNFDTRTEARKKQFEDALSQGIIPHNQNGKDIFTVETTELQKKLNKLLEERNKLEAEYQARQFKSLKDKEGTVQRKESDLKTLQGAAKDFENLNIFTSDGKIDKKFTDKFGKFDRGKFDAEANRIQGQALNASPDLESLKKVSELFAQHKQSLIEQAAAVEKAENLKVAEAKIQADKQAYDEQVKRIKAAKQAEIDTQQALRNSVADKGNQLAGFANQLFEGGGKLSDDDKKLVSEKIAEFQKAAQEALSNKNAVNIGGVLGLDPERLEDARRKFENAIATITRIRDRAGRTAPLSITDPSTGDSISPGEADDLFKRQLQQLQGSNNRLQSTQSEENILKQGQVKGPLADLQKQFPELAGVLVQTSDQVKVFAVGLEGMGIESSKAAVSLENLINQLQRLQKRPDIKVPDDKTEGQLPLPDSNVTYAATGGIVGLFPGQPRGQDRYPVWAAKDETIVDAQTSRMYRPMLDAIMARTAPRYMAAGGIVGDQTVGDVTNNITVNGGATNSETGRVIANTIERLIRRKQVRIKQS